MIRRNRLWGQSGGGKVSAVPVGGSPHHLIEGRHGKAYGLRGEGQALIPYSGLDVRKIVAEAKEKPGKQIVQPGM